MRWFLGGIQRCGLGVECWRDLPSEIVVGIEDLVILDQTRLRTSFGIMTIHGFSGPERERGGVMELTLSTEEQEFLSNILERSHRELVNEIAHTDHREFKQGLIKDAKLIESLIGRLLAAAPR